MGRDDNKNDYLQILQTFIDKAQQMDSMLSELTRDLLDVKDQSPPDKGRYINSAVSNLGNMHRALSSVKLDIQQAAQPPKGQQGGNSTGVNTPRQEESVQEDELTQMVQALVEKGYNRNMAARTNEIWYAHPAGHQISASISEAGLQWTYFPPRLSGEILRGLGVDNLYNQLGSLHFSDPQPQAQNEETKHEKVLEYLVQQTEQGPVDQFRVWQKGEQYPSIVAKNTQSGSWHCYTCSGNTVESSDLDKHIEVVKLWERNGKPKPKEQVQGNSAPQGSPPPGQWNGYERPGAQGTNTPIGLMDLNPRRRN